MWIKAYTESMANPWWNIIIVSKSCAVKHLEYSSSWILVASHIKSDKYAIPSRFSFFSSCSCDSSCSVDSLLSSVFSESLGEFIWVIFWSGGDSLGDKSGLFLLLFEDAGDSDGARFGLDFSDNFLLGLWHGNLLSTIWDIFHWNFIVKFGLKTAWDISHDILWSFLTYVNFWWLQGCLSTFAKIGCLQWGGYICWCFGVFLFLSWVWVFQWVGWLGQFQFIVRVFFTVTQW